MAKAPTEIRSLARQYTKKALKTLAHIMSEPSAPHAARVAASTALLDRGWGKPAQTLHVTDQPLDPDQISDGELAAIAAGRSPDLDEEAGDPSKFN